MEKVFSAVGIMVFAALCGPAAAGVLSKAVIGGQVQQFTDDGRVTGCGVTLVAFEEKPFNGTSRLMFNGSFMFSNPVTGLMKGRVVSIPESVAKTGNITAATVKPLRTKMFWAKAQGEVATTVVEGQALKASDDPGYFVYLTPTLPLLAMVQAVLDGTPVQIGVNSAEVKYEMVMFGTVLMSDDHKTALRDCMGEWAKFLDGANGGATDSRATLK